MLLAFSDEMSRFLDLEAVADRGKKSGGRSNYSDVDSSDLERISDSEGQESEPVPIQSRKRAIPLSSDSDPDLSVQSIQKPKRSKDKNYDLVLEELQKSNRILSVLVERVRKTEKRLKVIEENVSNSAVASGTPSRKSYRRKNDVPDEVRVCCCA